MGRMPLGVFVGHVGSEFVCIYVLFIFHNGLG